MARTADHPSLRQGRRWRQAYSLDGPWLQVAASPEIIDVVNFRGCRRGSTPDNWFTVPFFDAGERVASSAGTATEDVHVVKVFTYFSDVAKRQARSST